MAGHCELLQTTMCLPDSRKDKQPLFVQIQTDGPIGCGRKQIIIFDRDSIDYSFRETEGLPR
ncbi:hypothetical protein J6590_092435 [Homalodisca vitripennis]|nr:hypothetical protein J6590_092435 [Homalodisca vitripennis]